MEEGTEGRTLAGVALVLGMWLYALAVLLPLRAKALARRRHGVLAPGGLGRLFSPQPDGPRTVMRDGRAADFDATAADYDWCVGPFAGPLFAAALDAIAPSLRRGSRVLDVGCGPGAALSSVAKLVEEGEVVGIDLSLEMLRLAHERTRRAGSANVALFQADAAELPSSFTGSFDVAYSCLVHHHLTDPVAAVRGIAGALRSGGVYAAIDATGPRLTKIATPLARAADPGWVRFPGRDTLLALLADVGLERVSWVPLAPGIGMAIGTRP